MIIEVKGTGCHNKGAEMMLLTIMQELGNEKNIFTVMPRKDVCEYPCYSKYGIYPKVLTRVRDIPISALGNLLPKRFQTLYGLISDKDVDVVLDASGFSYSSQWGNGFTEQMAADSARWKKQGTKVILMPQAFGPFDNEKITQSMIEIIHNSSLIFARETTSYEELLRLVDDKNKVLLYPDFTVLFKGTRPSYFDETTHNVCIVPNTRMKDKKADAEDYEKVFARIIEQVHSKGMHPFFLVHGGAEDLALAEKINALLTQKIDIISEENPYYIKGIINNSQGLIGSRFHSLASSLYSAIPTLGTGWSHKNTHLFEEYGYEEGLFTLDITDEQIEEKVDYLVDAQKRETIRAKLQHTNADIEVKSREMFEQIKAILK